MRNGKHIMKQKFPRLSNLHINWVCVKRLTLAGLLVAAAWTVMNSSTIVFLVVAVGFLFIRSLIQLVSRFVITIVYIILLMLILGLIIF